MTFKLSSKSNKSIEIRRVLTAYAIHFILLDLVCGSFTNLAKDLVLVRLCLEPKPPKLLIKSPDFHTKSKIDSYFRHQ